MKTLYQRYTLFLYMESDNNNNNNKKKILIFIIILLMIGIIFYLYINIGSDEPVNVELKLIESEYIDGKYIMYADVQNTDKENIGYFNWTANEFSVYRGSAPLSNDKYDDVDIYSVNNIGYNTHINRTGNFTNINRSPRPYMHLNSLDEHKEIHVTVEVNMSDKYTIVEDTNVTLANHIDDTVLTPNCIEHEYTYGDGSIDNPYQVEDKKDFYCMRNDIDSNYIQTSDIYLSDSENWHGGLGFKPLSDYEGGAHTNRDGFTGTYNGDGYYISDLYINRSYQNLLSNSHTVSLFGINSGEIKNLKIQNSTIKGHHMASIIDQNNGYINNMVIENTYIEGSNVYGISTNNFGEISNSYSTANLNGTATVYGITFSAGYYNNECTINDSYFAGDVEDTNNLNELYIITSNSYCDINNIYYDSSKLSNLENNEAIGLSQNQMQGDSAKENMNIDFVNSWNIIDRDYPQLQWE